MISVNCLSHQASFCILVNPKQPFCRRKGRWIMESPLCNLNLVQGASQKLTVCSICDVAVLSLRIYGYSIRLETIPYLRLFSQLEWSEKYRQSLLNIQNWNWQLHQYMRHQMTTTCNFTAGVSIDCLMEAGCEEHKRQSCEQRNL